MKKIANIITIHKEPNYGALLQSYALYKTLENIGVTPRLIDLSLLYRKRRYNFWNRLLTNVKNYIKGYDKCYKLAQEFFESYAKNKTKPFYSYDQLKSFIWDSSEFFIVGSDQVWNPDITGLLSRAYTFEFLPVQCNNIYTYASSFGVINNEEERASQLDAKSFAKRFNKISVREAFGVEFLSKFGCTSEEVIDPTLLLESYVHLLPKKVIASDSILYLALAESTSMNEVVKQFSSNTNLPINKFYGYLQPSYSINKNFLTVNEWLYKIATSRLVITDSFHAIVFAIMFKKEFYYYNSHPNKSKRVENLLTRLEITNRIITDASQAELSSPIDYDKVFIKLDELRSHSLNYLKSIFCK